MSYFFSSESVSNGHPDKVADIISDSILDNFLSIDPSSRVACESLVTTGQVIVAGEVESSANLDFEKIIRNTINEIGYDKSEYKFSGNSCEIKSYIHEQSTDISKGIIKPKKEDLGAGDQGIMFGYACNETTNYIPLSLDLSHRIMELLHQERILKKNIDCLRPDSKSQVTVKYLDNEKISSVDSIIISTQHDDFSLSSNNSLKKLRKDLKNLVLDFVNTNYPSEYSDLFKKTNFLINPAGNFIIGGPHGDTGLTGRKIIVDTYGGKGSHGGGAFSGKDSTKVDRSAAYLARYISKNLVSAGVSSEIQIQLAYAIGLAQPVSINVNTFGKSNLKILDSEISKMLQKNFDFTPFFIQEKFKLRDPIFKETASYGHFGRNPEIVNKTFTNSDGDKFEKTVELFPWEKLDLVDEIIKIFKI